MPWNSDGLHQGTRCSFAGGTVAGARPTLPPEGRPTVGVSSCDFPEICDLLAKEAEVMLRNTKPTEGTKARST